MDDKRYQGLEKRFHKFQEKHLRDISALNDLPYGSAATTCKALVEKVHTAFNILSLSVKLK